MEGRWGRALLAAGAMGAGAYALLREEEDRRKDLAALDGALGGWVSWAIGDSKPAAAAVQMESAPPMPEEPSTEGPPQPATRDRQPASPPNFGDQASRGGERCGIGYPYKVAIDPAPAGSTVRWRLKITRVGGTAIGGASKLPPELPDMKPNTDEAPDVARSNQEARLAKLMDGCELLATV